MDDKVTAARNLSHCVCQGPLFSPQPEDIQLVFMEPTLRAGKADSSHTCSSVHSWRMVYDGQHGIVFYALTRMWIWCFLWEKKVLSVMMLLQPVLLAQVEELFSATIVVL